MEGGGPWSCRLLQWSDLESRIPTFGGFLCSCRLDSITGSKMLPSVPREWERGHTSSAATLGQVDWIGAVTWFETL